MTSHAAGGQQAGGDVREELSWSAFGEATRRLAEQVAASGYRPDIVLAVAHG